MILKPVDKHRFAKQPKYHTKTPKIRAREQIVSAYRQIFSRSAIPADRGYWTLCNWQPNSEGAEIVQLEKMGLLHSSQFFGVDYDLRNEGIIEHNKQCHPNANWFRGDWLEVIDENYYQFNPAIVCFDYTRTIMSLGCHLYLARTMDMCPVESMVAANLMLTDGHSSRQFDPKFLLENLKGFRNFLKVG